MFNSARYSLAATAPTDNCLLSNIPFAKLNFYTELEPDRDYDIYAIIDELRVRQNSKKPGNHVRPNRPPPEGKYLLEKLKLPLESHFYGYDFRMFLEGKERFWDPDKSNEKGTEG